MIATAETKEQKLRRLLETDDAFYAESLLYIVDQEEEERRLVLKPAQRRFLALKAKQEAEGVPVRIIVLKARKEGLCLDPSTRVLTEDLRWVPIDSVAPGHRLVATDENPPGGRGHHRRLRVATVEGKGEVQKRAYRLRMSDGRELIATARHRFLVRTGGGAQWRRVEQLKPGSEIRHVTEPWSEADYEDGWFGGLLDGEGTVRRKERAGCEMTITQRPGAVYERALRYLVERRYTAREEVDRRTVEEAPGRFGDRPVNRVAIGRMNELFRLVGQTRPTRFLRSDWWEGKELPGKRSGEAWVTISSIEALDERRMIDLQTDTKTFIAEGFVSHNSTIVQGCLIKRVTQRRNHLAAVVAHEGDTAEGIFGMGETMYSKLPDQVVDGLVLKPPKTGGRTGSELRLGETSRQRRSEGERGVNSAYIVDTANNYESMRGLTIFSLHLSEFAFYQNPEKKARSLFNAVPDTPATMIVIESTANGYNMFRRLWLAAVSGRSNYLPLFIPWFEDPHYTMPFANPEEREHFVAEILGEGDYGEAEPALVELGVSLEQLKWRRWAIENKAAGDIRSFWQEYPATWEEAFLSSGRQVFAPSRVAKVVERAKEIEPYRGLIRARSKEDRVVRGDTIAVPRNPFWLPESEIADSGERIGVATPRWKVWEPPMRGVEEILAENGAVEQPMVPPGQYVLFLDSAAGQETVSEGQDYFAIQVINHRTRAQCAVWHARGVDPDEVAEELYKAALWFGPEFPPWVGIETTGGYGLSIANRMWRGYRFPTLYFRNPAESKGEAAERRLGFSMNKTTKPLVVDNAKILLRDERDGIRDPETAAEMLTFVRDEKGVMGAEENHFDDLIDAYMGAQYLASEKPLRQTRFGRPVEAQRVRRAPRMGRRGGMGGYPG